MIGYDAKLNEHYIKLAGRKIKIVHSEFALNTTKLEDEREIKEVKDRAIQNDISITKKHSFDIHIVSKPTTERITDELKFVLAVCPAGEKPRAIGSQTNWYDETVHKPVKAVISEEPIDIRTR